MLASRESALSRCALTLDAPNTVRIRVPHDVPIRAAFEIQAFLAEELLTPPLGGPYQERRYDSDVPSGAAD